MCIMQLYFLEASVLVILMGVIMIIGWLVTLIAANVFILACVFVAVSLLLILDDLIAVRAAVVTGELVVVWRCVFKCEVAAVTVSYTHLTLPTICSV